jgi:nitrilase
MSIPSTSSLRVAVTQHEPEWLDLQNSVKKVCGIIAEAAENKADIVTFAEAFIPGYPAWIWYSFPCIALPPGMADHILRTRPLDPALSIQYIKNSLKVDSEEMQTIQDCAAKHGIVVSLGFSENVNNSLYIAQAIIDSDGKLLMKRRKIKATHMERTIFGDASGSSLLNVVPTSIGKRVGALACWVSQFLGGYVSFGCLESNSLSKCLTTHETLSSPKLYHFWQY